jgi:hypothetical protein
MEPLTFTHGHEMPARIQAEDRRFFPVLSNTTSQKKVKGDSMGYEMGICPTPFCHNPSYSQIIISLGIRLFMKPVDFIHQFIEKDAK